MEKEPIKKALKIQAADEDELFVLAYEKKMLGEFRQAAEIFEELNKELRRDDNKKQRRRVMLEAARVNFMLGRYAKAHTFAEAVVELFPDDEDAQVILGKIGVAEYKSDAARFHFNQLPDDNADKHLGLCLIAIKERRLLQAQEALSAAEASVDRENPEYLLLWSYVRLLEGNHKNALAQVREIMRDPPKDTTLLLLAAEIYMTSGTYGEAKKVTQLVNKYAPEHDHAFAVRAYALYAEEEYKSAELDAYKALKLNKNNAYALTVLMKCATRKGDVGYAETLGLRILHDTPGYSLGHANLGDVYFNQGDYARARIEYNQCRHLMDSLTKGALLRKARMMSIEGDVQGAVRILRGLIESHHSYYDDAMCDLALCYERLGENDQKNDILERMEIRRAMYHRTEQVMEKLG